MRDLAGDLQLEWYASELPLHGGVVADVGANVGRLSEGFWRAAGPSGRVVSIEPLVEHAETISARIAAVGAGRWAVLNEATSSRAGQLTVHVFDDEFGRNSMVVAAERRSAASRQVACRALADQVPDATVVKIDIEGHEYEVLDAAVPAMPGVQAWAIEFHMVSGRPLADALGRLARAGYQLRAAGRAADRPTGPWRSIPIHADLSWSAVPVAKITANGEPFKMLHVIAVKK